MDDGPRFEPAPPQDRATGASPGDAGEHTIPPHLADSRVLQILTTEHWSLLTSRSLVYNETFARGAMFLTFLSASLVALGFVAGSGVAGSMLPMIAIPILVLDLFVGLATLGRLIDATVEEFHALQGMARLRHAYMEIAPDLEPYISAATHDDMITVLGAYGPPDEENVSNLRNVVHGLTTMPGMVMVIDSAIAGALAGVVAIVVGLAAGVSLAIAIVVGVLGLGLFAVTSMRVFSTIERRFETRFPAPGIPAWPSQPSATPPPVVDPAQEARRNT